MAYQSLEEAREQAGFTQDEVASELGIVRQTYAKIEHNPELMTIGQARIVCSLLNIRLSEIVFRASVNGNSPEKILETMVN